jgi:hypothetical protein
MHAFFDKGKYSITTLSVPTVIAVATKELGNVYSRAQHTKSLCMAPLDTGIAFDEVIRAMVPAVSRVFVP